MPESCTTFGTELHLEIEAAAGKRAALEHALRVAIHSGRLAAQSRLPSSRALAAELGVSRGTVIAAYDQLAAEGYVTAQRGSGTQVANLADQSPDAPLPPHPVTAWRYDLLPGSPDLAAFPVAAWLRATRRVLRAAPAHTYDYGDPQGHQVLRSALARYLGRTRGVLTTADHIVITSGTVQAVSLLTRVLHDAGITALATEDPGWDIHRLVAERSGLGIVALPVDDCGARTELLSTAAFSDVGAAAVTPAHQYPTGVAMPPGRRHAMVEWAHVTGGLVMEDDYDGEFRYDRRAVGALQGMAPQHVAYLGTVAKTLGPALRLGWIVLPANLVGAVTEARLYTDMQNEVIGQLALAEMINSHAYERHIRSRRLSYQRRRDLLVSRVEAIGDRAGHRYRVSGVAAGLHVLITLPEGGPTEADIVAAAEANGLAVAGLSNQWHNPDDHPAGVVIGYAKPSEADYPAALDTLIHVLTKALA